MPRVDAIGVSSAGVYINNRVMVASLFRGISPELFEKKIKPLFLDLQKTGLGSLSEFDEKKKFIETIKLEKQKIQDNTAALPIFWKIKILL